MAGNQIAVPQFLYSKKDLEEQDLSFFNLHLKQLVDAVNQLAGNHGPVEVSDGLVAKTVTSGSAKWTAGRGNPNGQVAGNVGDLYTRTDGGAGTTLYVKESKSGLTSGWVAK